jgi:hypothetical protein
MGEGRGLRRCLMQVFAKLPQAQSTDRFLFTRALLAEPSS